MGEPKTNKQALIQVLEEHLFDLAVGRIYDVDQLLGFACRGRSCYDLGNKCERCFAQWLAQPYDGSWELREDDYVFAGHGFAFRERRAEHE